MSNVGYGNHDAPNPGSAGAEPERAKTDQAETDRPGMDLGGAKDRSAPDGQMAGSHANPSGSGKAPGSGVKEGAGTVLTESADDRNTPGAGALPGNMQGGEVDPGAG